MTFRERLREQIDYCGFLDKEVASMAGISKRTIDSYVGSEACMPSAEVAVRIARVLGVTVEYLVTGERNPQTHQNTEAYIWDNIPFEVIADKFFGEGFSIPETSRAFQQIDLLTEWVKTQTEKGEMLKWNVLLCGVKTNESTPDDKLWHLPNGITIGKINRSCKTDSEDRVNIGVLSGKKDYVADITEEMLGAPKWAAMISSKSISNDYKEYRELAGVSKTPLFLIYMIDRNSQPTRGDRTPLNMANDLIGITMVTPGIRGTRGTVTRIKIKQLDNSQEVDE